MVVLRLDEQVAGNLPDVSRSRARTKPSASYERAGDHELVQEDAVRIELRTRDPA